MDWDPLVAAAEQARSRAYAPYSRFAVGAAVLMGDGSIHPGCNVENRSYGLTICAERVALAAAVVRGERQPRAIAVVTDTDPPSPPCGLCLQALAELAEDLPILLANPQGDRQEVRLSQLLPNPFRLSLPR